MSSRHAARLLTTFGILFGLVSGNFLHASPLSALSDVCTTDEQTLTSIRADKDQTLWAFMESVCQGNFSIVPTDIHSRVAAPVTPAGGEIDRLASQELEASLPNSVGVDLTPSDSRLIVEASVKNTQAESANLDQVAAREAQGAGPRYIEQIPPVQVAANTPEAPPQSLLYALLRDEGQLGFTDHLPEPIAFKPGMLSRYKYDQYTAIAASNQGAGVLRLRAPESVVPYGLYAGTHLSWSRSDSQDVHSALPGWIIGYSDERAIRDYENFKGSGFRVEFQWERRKRDDQKWTWDSTDLSGEFYLPMGLGNFVGLGAEISRSDRVPMVGHGTYDTETWSVYLPLGRGFTNGLGHSGKLQFNALLLAKSKAKFSQLVSGTYSDPTVRYSIGDGFSIKYDYSFNSKIETFLEYQAVGTSDPYSYTSNGSTVTTRNPRGWSFEAGLRAYW